MRAGRLLDTLLLLQTRSRVSARELAATFEISERTVYRDIEALSGAGVPVYAVRGRGGGFELLDGFRLEGTVFSEPEAEALLLGSPDLAGLLGLEEAQASAERRVLEALPTELADHARGLRNRFLRDDHPDDAYAGQLRLVSKGIWQCRMVELDGQVVAPLGLVSSRGSWHLAAGDPPEMVALDAVQMVRLTRRRFERPAAFDLAAVWDAGRADL